MTEYSKPILIAAMGRNREIGQNGTLPWYIPEDLQFFKKTTLDSMLIMGRKTWEGMPAVKRRMFAVVTRGHPTFEEQQKEGVLPSDIFYFNSVELAIHNATTFIPRSFVAGGAQIYDYVLKNKLVDKMYITHVRGDFPDADAFFPEVAWNEWDGTVLMLGSKTEKSPAYEIIEYTRR